MKLIRLLLLALLLPLAVLAQQPTTGNNGNGILFASAQQNTTVNSSDQTNLTYQGAHIVINTTAYTSGTYTPHVQGKDPNSGVYYDILVGTGSNTVTGTGTIVLKVYPGTGAIAGGATNDMLPQIWRLQMVASGGAVATFSAAYLGDF